MKNLAILRKEKGLTQEDIAQQLGIARPSYTRYETGEREPDFKMVIKLADFFEVSIDHLLGRKDYTSPTSACSDSTGTSRYPLDDIKIADNSDIALKSIINIYLNANEEDRATLLQIANLIKEKSIAANKTNKSN